MRRFATLNELRTVYSLNDLMAFHDAIREYSELQQQNSLQDD